MEPFDGNQRNGQGMNLSDGIWMEPLNRNQRNGDGLNLSYGIGLEPLDRNQRNGDGLNLSYGIGLEAVDRNQRHGDGLNLSYGIGLEPVDRNQRHGDGLNLSYGVGMEPLDRNQRNGEGLDLSYGVGMEPLGRNQRSGEGLNLSDGIEMAPLDRNQRNGDSLNLSYGIEIPPLSRNQRVRAGLNSRYGIAMEPLDRNQRNEEGLNLSDGIETAALSRNQRIVEDLNFSEVIEMMPLDRNQTSGEGLNLSDGIEMAASRNQRIAEGLNFSEMIEMMPLDRNQRSGEGLNLGGGIGMKRVSVGVEGNSVVKKARLADEVFRFHKFINENVALEKVKVDEHLEGTSQLMVSEKLDESIAHKGNMDILEGGGIKKGAMGAGEFVVGCQEGGLSSVPEESHNGNLGSANGGNELGFDLNIPALEAGDGSTLVGLREDTPRTVELNEIRSHESDRREERMNRGKAKQIEETMPYDTFGNVTLELGVMNKDQDIGGSNQLGGEKRYTREEKGKAKVDNFWLSLTALPVELDLQHRQQQQQEEAVETVPQLGSIQHRQNVDVSPIENVNNNTPNVIPQVGSGEGGVYADLTPPTLSGVEVRKRSIAENASRQAIALREKAPRFARYDASREGSSAQEKKLPTLETLKDLGNTPDPFSTALKRIKERIPKQKGEKLVRWEAAQNPENKEFPRVIPSLLDLSLKALAENAEAIVSLQGVPDILRQRLTELLCNSRKMSSHMLDLLVQGSPTQIRIKDCSWLTEKQFCDSFRDFDRRNLMVLQLDLCGQPALDHVLGTTIAPSSNSLPNLAILSLRGASRMSDRALEILVTSAPSLQSIDLGQCSLLSHTGIDIVANLLGSILKELYIDECQSIDAILISPALEKLEHLEVLSVAGIHSVCDQFLSELLAARGQNLKELDISDCENLTDQSLKFIGDTCANLHSLNISNLSNLTDVGLQFLANGCQSIRKLKFCRNSFSDEGIAAFLEASGACLEELSLNNCSKVSTITAFSLANSSRKLLHLDLSWCRRISDEELGLIVDSCLSLKLLKLFGCTQITDVFINGHSNTVVQIIGLSMTPIFDKISRFDGMEVLLKHSPTVFQFMNDHYDSSCI